MTEDEKWQLFHEYRRLAEEGKAVPLVCTCGTTFVTRVGKHDNLVLWCASCDTKTTPGVILLERVKGTVSEWIL